MLIGFFFLAMSLLSCYPVFAQANEGAKDSTQNRIPKIEKEKIPGYYRVGVDISKWVTRFIQSNYKTAEMQIDRRLRQNVYGAIEMGYAHASLTTEKLRYQTKNAFVSVGPDKTLFNRLFPGDIENAMVGMRYGMSWVQRADAQYTIADSIWGNTQGMVPSTSFFCHWIELNAGFRLEVKKNIFAGWNIRFRGMLNQQKLKELPPDYIAGYGSGEKPTSLGYNFYVMYGFGRR